MTTKTFATVTLVSLMGAAAGCGSSKTTDGTAQLRYTPNGSLVLFAGNEIDVYDAQLASLQASIPTPQPKDAVSPSGSVFSLSDDGTVAGVATSAPDDNQVELFKIPSGDSLPPVDLGPPPTGYAGYGPEDMALSPHGDLVYVIGPVDGMYRKTGMFDTATGARLWTTDWAIMPIFSPDGSRLHVNGDHGQALQGLDARTGAQGLDTPTTTSVERLGMMPDANTLIALVAAGCQTPQVVSFSSVVASCPMSIAFLSTADGSTLRSFPLDPTTVLYGTTPLGLPAFRCSTAAGLCAVGVMTFDQTTMLAGDVVLQVWRTDGTLAQSIKIEQPQELTAPNDLAISPDGQFLAIAATEGVTIYRISDGARVRTRPYGQTAF